MTKKKKKKKYRKIEREEEMKEGNERYWKGWENKGPRKKNGDKMGMKKRKRKEYKRKKRMSDNIRMWAWQKINK